MAKGLTKIVPSDAVVGVDPFVVYAVIKHGEGSEYTVEVNSETGSANIISKLSGSSSGDLDNVGPSQEINNASTIDLCTPDESLVLELEALGLDFEDFDECEDRVVLVVLLWHFRHQFLKSEQQLRRTVDRA